MAERLGSCDHEGYRSSPWTSMGILEDVARKKRCGSILEAQAAEKPLEELSSLPKIDKPADSGSGESGRSIRKLPKLKWECQGIMSNYIDLINANRLRSGMPIREPPAEVQVISESEHSGSSSDPEWMNLDKEEASEGEAEDEEDQDVGRKEAEELVGREEGEEQVGREEAEDLADLEDVEEQENYRNMAQANQGNNQSEKGSNQKGKDGLQGQKARRQIVDYSHVCKLVEDYHKHFNIFSKDRKKAIIQLIRRKVWENVYKDYKSQFPNSKFKEESLKVHLRLSLTEMKSGVNNPDGGETATIQDESLMRQLMQTPAMKARNILKIRQVASSREIPAMDFTSPSKRASSIPPSVSSFPIADEPEAVNSVAAEINQCKAPPPPPVKDKATTKSQNLKRAGEDISSMLSEFTKISQVSQIDAASKKQCTEAKAALLAVKKLEAEQRMRESDAREKTRQKESEVRTLELETRQEAQAQQNMMGKISILERQKTLGLITEEEFKDKCKIIFGI